MSDDAAPTTLGPLIPDEVWDTIIEYASEDVPTLFAMAVVHSTWLRRVRYRLFECLFERMNITARNSPKVLQLLDSARVAANIHGSTLDAMLNLFKQSSIRR